MGAVDFKALPIGTLLKVRDEMLAEVNSLDYDGLDSLGEVITRDGYIFRFTEWAPDEPFPVQTKSLATGNVQEFYDYEVEPVEKEQE